MRWSWLLALVLALPAFAAERRIPVVEVHPLILGGLYDPASPVAKELTARAADLSRQFEEGRLSPSAAAAYLAPLAQGSAVERPVAAILARVLVDPQATSKLLSAAPNFKKGELTKIAGAAETAEAKADAAGRTALQDLALASTKDPYAKLVFDGYAPPSALEGVVMTANGPSRPQGQDPERLGAGSFGMVHEHPNVAGAVIKTIFYPKNWGVEARRKMYEFAYEDERTARKLANAGAGPRLLAHTDELGSPVLIKERVYGSNVYDLIKDGLYNARHHAMILALIDKLARAGIVPTDLREPNIMIGRTLLDPERKAYLIDGGDLDGPLSPKNRGALAREIYRGPARWLSKDPDGTEVLKSKPLNQILEEALVKSGSASWLVRLRVAWRRWRGADRVAVEPAG